MLLVLYIVINYFDESVHKLTEPQKKTDISKVRPTYSIQIQLTEESHEYGMSL